MSSGKLKHFCLNKDWWEKNNSAHLYDEVFKLTHFLDETTTIRERLYYIQNNWRELQLCLFCKTNRRKFWKTTLTLSDICGSAECKRKKRSITTTLANKNLSEHTRQKKADKCRLANTGSFEQRFGEERARILKEQMSSRMKGTKQKKETIEKRANSNKGKILSDETKLKISQSNKKTHNSKEYLAKRYETHRNMGKKLSLIMKKKIMEGKFTPNITNSWTRRNIELNVDGLITKYRSSWDAAFAMLNPSCQYEKIRIPYELDGHQKTYIADFADFDNLILYEIKPNSVKSRKVCVIKELAARRWALRNGWEYKMISDDWFMANINLLEDINFPHIKLLKKGLRQ
jgi:hypothetical protein